MDYYHQLRYAAEKSRRKFLYDTNVGAGLPVIENLQNLLNAGDELMKFSGILSGSLSYIFGKLDEGMSFSEATTLARKWVIPNRTREMIFLVWMWRVNY